MGFHFITVAEVAHKEQKLFDQTNTNPILSFTDTGITAIDLNNNSYYILLFVFIIFNFL